MSSGIVRSFSQLLVRLKNIVQSQNMIFEYELSFFLLTIVGSDAWSHNYTTEHTRNIKIECKILEAFVCAKHTTI